MTGKKSVKLRINNSFAVSSTLAATRQVLFRHAAQLPCGQFYVAQAIVSCFSFDCHRSLEADFFECADES